MDPNDASAIVRARFRRGALHFVYFVNIIYKALVSICKKMKKNSHRARKTRLASVRARFVAAALPAVYFVNIIYKTLVSIEKNGEK